MDNIRFDSAKVFYYNTYSEIPVNLSSTWSTAATSATLQWKTSEVQWSPAIQRSQKWAGLGRSRALLESSGNIDQFRSRVTKVVEERLAERIFCLFDRLRATTMYSPDSTKALDNREFFFRNRVALKKAGG